MDIASLLSIVTGISIGAAAGYLGSLMLGRRMSLVAGPLGHLTLPGVALALLYGFDVSLGAFPFVAVGIAAIWLLELKTRLPLDALTAIVFATGVAIAFLLLPIDQAEAALVGDISRVGIGDMVAALLGCVIVVACAHRIYPQLVLINISEDLALSEGIRVRRINFTYLLLIAVVVALGVKLVGGLLTAALVAIPPAAARNVSTRLGQYALLSTMIGVVSTLAGILLYRLTGLPAGPLVVLVSAVCFLATLPFARPN